jgi:hypothetical protein
MRKRITICLEFAQLRKKRMTDIGTRTRIVQKSGKSHTRAVIQPSIMRNGINPPSILCKRGRCFLKKAAKKSIRESLINSVGCMVKGIHGIVIHPFAPFQLGPITRTVTSRAIEAIRINFVYFSREV